ncbi:RNA polymerase sigma factor [Spirosoma areae]
MAQSSTPVRTDEELWRSFIDGSEMAFEELFKRNYPKLYQYGRKYSPDNEFIKDVLQELFAELWARRSHLHQTASVRHYLYKSLRRKMLRLKSNYPVTTELTDESNPFTITLSPEQLLLENEFSAEQRQQMEQWLMWLTPRQREAIYLRFYHDLDYEETASIMNVGPHTIRNLIYEAIKLLRSRLIPILLGVLMTMHQ